MSLNGLSSLLTPITLAAFGAVAVTGGLMFFHLVDGPVEAAHGWIGLTFVGAGLLHAVKNRAAILNYAQRPLALAAVGTVLAGATAAAVLMPEEHEGRGGPPTADERQARRDDGDRPGRGAIDDEDGPGRGGRRGHDGEGPRGGHGRGHGARGEGADGGRGDGPDGGLGEGSGGGRGDGPEGGRGRHRHGRGGPDAADDAPSLDDAPGTTDAPPLTPPTGA